MIIVIFFNEFFLISFKTCLIFILFFNLHFFKFEKSLTSFMKKFINYYMYSLLFLKFNNIIKININTHYYIIKISYIGYD
jgi:hypothetical protein